MRSSDVIIILKSLCAHKYTQLNTMARSSHLLVIQSSECKYSRISDGHLILEYSISDSIKNVISARLITVDGLKKTVFVYTDFTKPQTVNGVDGRYLGISSYGSMPVVNTYIPIAGSQLSSVGYISVRLAVGKFTKVDKNVTVIIEILSETQNGA